MDTLTSNDFRGLADQLKAASESALHPDLWLRRYAVADRLYQMSVEPQNYSHRSVYLAVKFLVW